MPAATHRHIVVRRKKRAGTRRPLKPGSRNQQFVRMPQRRRRERLISGSETETGRDQRTDDVEPERP